MVYPWKPAANDDLHGGQGDDSYLVLEPTDAAIERPNEGYDTVEVYHTDYTLGPNVEKLARHMLDHNYSHRYTGNALDNDMIGGYGSDVIDGLGGGDMLDGPGGNDTIYGGLDNDTLIGAADFDKLYGQGGTDRFDYDAISESAPGAGHRDVILDFDSVGAEAGDRIDLSDIDAIDGGSDDGFTFVGTAAFTAPGQLRMRDVSSTNTNTLIQANTTGTSGPEFEIVVVDGNSAGPDQWAAGDFIW